MNSIMENKLYKAGKQTGKVELTVNLARYHITAFLDNEPVESKSCHDYCYALNLMVILTNKYNG